jgi:hypothetical protein
MVEEVKKFCPELEAEAFFGPERRSLKNREIKVVNTLSAEVASTRGSEPKPKAGGSLKHDALIHPDPPKVPPSLDFAPPEVALRQPEITLGRKFPIPKPALWSGVFAPLHVIFTGNPRWKVVTPSTPQPETAFPKTPSGPIFR